MASKRFLAALQGQRFDCPPFWLMRQAGRYLPEYRAVRAEAGGFLELCFTPKHAIEVTLQPLRRYRMDAAILFSDILVIPYALGQKLWFAQGEGPQLEPIRSREALALLDPAPLHDRLAPVYEAVAGIREGMAREGFADDTALIGFAGAPWTIASYVVEGAGSKEYAHVKQFAFGDPDGFQSLIDLIVRSTADYLCRQVDAGVEAIQIFDSWAGVLPEPAFRRWVIEPNRQLVAAVKARHPNVPVIGFPRHAGLLYPDYVDATGVDAVSLDTTVPLGWAAQTLQTRKPVQGNLDPALVVAGGRAMEDEVARIRRALQGGPYVFNLGHGVMQTTPPEHVARLAELLRAPLSA